jgi:hypothetical protein
MLVEFIQSPKAKAAIEDCRGGCLLRSVDEEKPRLISDPLHKFESFTSQHHVGRKASQSRKISTARWRTLPPRNGSPGAFVLWIIASSFGLISSGTKMRIITILILLCTFSKVASAQTTEQCPPTPRAGDLLACYNRTAPPPALGKRATSKVTTALDKPAASKTPTDQRAQYVDVLTDENKKLDTKLKTLCRGC